MQKVVVANWKMHKTIEETTQFIEALIPLINDCDVKILLAVPFTALAHAARQVKGTNIQIGAQNIDFHSKGPYTGEISAEMIKEAGAEFVVVGHSERRRLFHESSEVVNLKVRAALAAKIQPLICVGETLEQRQEDNVEGVLKVQLATSFAGLTAEQISLSMLAYEPVWAIGTNLTAMPEDIASAHHFCRNWFAEAWGVKVGQKLPILYGGSVNGDNAQALLKIPNVDGVLVGGASLVVESFSKIVLLKNYS
ncbi:MAG: triose-phosphate isomerase [Parachlamydiaceae bacterium]